jgi:hypothetical protein
MSLVVRHPHLLEPCKHTEVYLIGMAQEPIARLPKNSWESRRVLALSPVVSREALTDYSKDGVTGFCRRSPKNTSSCKLPADGSSIVLSNTTCSEQLLANEATGHGSPHPCRTYGVARPAERLVSMALCRPSLISLGAVLGVAAVPG